MVQLSFEHPEYLWFLFAVPLLIIIHFWLLRHTKKKALQFANFQALKRVTGKRFITRNITLLVLRIIIIVSMVLAIAQTSFWYEGSTNQNEFVILLDTSASMTAIDVAPSRLEAAKTYASQFLDRIDSQSRVGLVSFSGVTFIESTLTDDRAQLRDTLANIEPVAAGGTDIPGAIITGTNTIIGSEKGRALILITDGSNTIEAFSGDSIQRAVSYAQSNHVKIYTIGVGSQGAQPIGYLPTIYNVSMTYNADNLVQIANATDGKYYEASNEQELIRAYNDIAAADQASTLGVELPPYLVLLSLVLILLEWLLINTRFRTIP